MSSLSRSLPAVVWLSSADATDSGLVGEKFYNLAKLARAGLPVPPAFVVTTAAYRRLPVVARHRDAFTAGEIRERLREDEIPPALTSEIIQAYAELGGGSPSPVAVRSSATAEDLGDASYAGQQDTLLNVIGADDVLRAVRTCWSSLYSDRVVAYRERQGAKTPSPAMAVGVQVLVASRVAGVMFTSNHNNGSREEMVVEASWGLGEAVVSGIVTPDRYVIDKRTGLTIDEEIGSKDVIIRYRGGSEPEKVTDALQGLPCLTVTDRRNLVDLAREVEAYYGAPQDVEWAIDEDHRVFVLQARPITTWKEAAGASQPEAPPSRHHDLLRKLFYDTAGSTPSD